MKIKIKISPGNTVKNIELKTGSTVYDLLKKIQLKPDTVIVIKDDIPIPIDDIINQNNELRIIKVASGG